MPCLFDTYKFACHCKLSGQIRSTTFIHFIWYCIIYYMSFSVSRRFCNLFFRLFCHPVNYLILTSRILYDTILFFADLCSYKHVSLPYIGLWLVQTADEASSVASLVSYIFTKVFYSIEADARLNNTSEFNPYLKENITLHHYKYQPFNVGYIITSKILKC
jgi:hypothetical protein